jgi:glutaredoxin 3
MNIIIYTKSNCPNCVSAKALLKSNNLEYEEISLDDDAKRAQFCASHPGVQQMPQIFYKGERIGGFAGLREWIKWKGQQ